MAIVYAGMGMAAGLAGEGLAAALQNPWVLGSFAVMLGGLALGMFGLYELQMPSFIQNQAIGWSNRFRGGSFAGVFIMGGLSALILGPCVAAPLAGALVFISQTRDLVIGGTALFFMGLGMGMPLLLVGMSAGSLLPRTGAWMELVKHMFGLLLVATAVWIISPVLPIPMQMLLWSACLLGAAYVFGGVFARTQPSALRLVGMACAALAVVFLIGAASGGQSLLQPLAHLQARASSGTSASALGAAHGLPFTRIHSTQELDAALAQAGTQNRTVMLDFYADWCVACKEFESFTFSDPKVRERIATGGLQLLQADVTANNAQDKALLKRFALFGPPAIVFLTGRQPQRVAHQVVGYQNAQEFLLSLDRVIAP
jgi:thiol:disulfide interchange protein DsbD